MSKKKSPIRSASELVGGQRALADAIGVAPALVWQWVNGHRPIAPKHCPAIERATQGAITCEKLNPKVKWDRDADNNVTGYSIQVAAA